jgi:hypothetical protein
MGVFVDQISDIYDPEDLTSFSWSDAQAARDTMSVYLHIKAIFLDGAVLKKVQGLNDAMLELLSKRRGKSFEGSNLGFTGIGMQDGAQRGG